MKSLRLIIILAIISIIAIFLGSAARSYYKFLKEPMSPTINAIPQSASIIVKTKNVFHFFEAVNKSVLSDLLGTLDIFSTLNSYVDSINYNNPKLVNFLETNEVIFALIPLNEDKMSLLLATSVGKSSSNTINNYIKNLIGGSESSIIKIDNQLFKITHNEAHSWYYLKQGVFALSNDSSVLINSLNCLEHDTSIAKNDSFYKLFKTGGKKVDANIIVNTKVLASSLVPHLSKRLEKDTPFDQWTTFDLNIKKSEILFGGFTFTTSDHAFIGQDPVEFNELDVYPLNTGMAVSLSLSDQQLYTSHFFTGDTIHVNGFDSSIEQQNKEIFNRKKHINAWIGNTVSIIYTIDYFRGDRTGMMMMIRHSNIDSAKNYLHPYLEPLEDSLFKMHFESFPSKLWGTMFIMPGKLFCRYTKDHVIFSPNKSLLRNYEPKKRLSNNKEVKFAKEWSGNTSNVFVLLRPDIVGKWLLRSGSVKNRDLANFFKENSSIGMQYSAGSDLQYTHAWLIPKVQVRTKSKTTKSNTTNPGNAKTKSTANASKSSNTESENKNSMVETFADQAIELTGSQHSVIDMKTNFSTIQLLNSKTRNTRLIAIIHSNGRISVLNNSGKKLWHYDVSDPVTSKIIEIDYYRNGKMQYLVSTKNKLHIIDVSGKEIKESPVKLPKAARSEISVFDYDNKKEYRILYVGTDNRIYNTTIQGTELPDWQKPVVSGKGTIEFHRTHGKDYLIFKDKNGSVKIFDRRGRERIRVDNSLKLSQYAGLHANTTNSKGIFISVSDKGELIYIDAKGKVSKTSFGKLSNNPWFTYTDFDSDGSTDFIFAEKSQIIAFNRLKERIAFNTIKGEFGTPFIYASSSQDVWIFARNIKNNEIIGFNNKGKVYKGPSYYSETDPIVFNPGGSLKELLITSRDNKVFLTEIEGL